MTDLLNTPTGAGKTESAIEAIVSAIGLAMLQRTLDSGQAIEIPSLGIVIEPDPERRTVTMRAMGEATE